MQAIITRFHGATDTKGARISATASAGKVYVEYDYSLNHDDNHRRAAVKLMYKFKWWGTDEYPTTLHSGQLPSGDEVHVLVRDWTQRTANAVEIERAQHAIASGDAVVTVPANDAKARNTLSGNGVLVSAWVYAPHNDVTNCN